MSDIPPIFLSLELDGEIVPQMQRKIAALRNGPSVMINGLYLYSTLLPQVGRQLELCWRTSWESHPSEELSELRIQKYHYRLTGSLRNSVPMLCRSEWVSLCTLSGRPIMRNDSAQVVFAHSTCRWLRQLMYSSCRVCSLQGSLKKA